MITADGKNCKHYFNNQTILIILFSRHEVIYQWQSGLRAWVDASG